MYALSKPDIALASSPIWSSCSRITRVPPTACLSTPSPSASGNRRAHGRRLAPEARSPAAPETNVEAFTDPHDVRPDGNAHFTDAGRVAQSITDDSWKDSTLSDVAKAPAATDPDRARLIADAERIAQSITGDDSKASALAAIAGALAGTDPGR